MFVDKLISEIKVKQNPSILGLDPSIENIPTYIKKKYYSEVGVNVQGACQAILHFNIKLIDAIADIIPAIKIQSAYFEMYGIEGIKILKETADYAKSKRLLIIHDVKRNDIGTTAAAYSTAYLGETVLDNELKQPMFGMDCMTVTPYLGSDGIVPFIEDCKKYGKGIFVLVKTSNKSSGEFQDLKVGEKHLYEIVAEHVEKWGSELVGESGYSSVGAVVGATYPEQAKVLRKLMPQNYFLVPGYGSQGGTGKDILPCFNQDGLGAVVNASRSLMYAYKTEIWKDKYNEESFDAATRAEAIRMRDDINNVLDGGKV